MSDENRPKTIEEAQQQVAYAASVIEATDWMRSFTIDDYPIGSRNRGKCKLEYEVKKGEFRTVRTTTDKYGRWCKPKTSVYTDAPMLIVAGVQLDHEAAWLRTDNRAIYLQWANGNNLVLCRAPSYFPPQREERRTVWKTRTLVPTESGLMAGETVREDVDVTPADPPEKIALWDAYMEVYVPLRRRIHEAALKMLADATVTV